MGLLDSIKDFYKEPAPAEPIQDKEVIDKTYAQWRMRIFLSMFFGYIVFYTCRKNISVALPEIQNALGYNAIELGLLGSSLYFFYAIGKFINGIIADNTNVKKILPTALFMSALVNILFAVCAHFVMLHKVSVFGIPLVSILLWILALIWGINGWFQSMGFTPIAKNLTYWFSNKERGVKWSLWSSSHEIGTYISVILSGFLITHYGWEAVFYIPACFSMVFCIFFYKNLQDKPSSMGLPEIETYKDPDYVKPEEEVSEEDNFSYDQIFEKYILKNSTVWLLAITYIFVYIVRNGSIDWITKYLVDMKGYSIAEAAKRLSFLPLVGVLGTVGAGFVSDKFFKSKRAPVNIICLVFLVLSLYLFKINQHPILDYVYISLIGVFTCGPQVLVGGLSAVESSSKKVASAVTGFCGMFGYIGSIFSGIGTGFIIQKFSWNSAINFWIISAVIALAICFVLLRKETERSR